MPKVTGPLFSLGAGGTLGKAITYKGSISGARVEKVPRPRNVRSAAQVLQRNEFKDGASFWKTLTPEEKAAYTAGGDVLGITGYNYFLQQWLFDRESIERLNTVYFGWVTDTHYADKEPTDSTHYRESEEKLLYCVSEWNAWKADFVIQTGDFIDGYRRGDRNLSIADLQVIEAAYAELNCPRYYSIGNHCMYALYKQDFLDYTGCEARWVSWDMKERHFISLDDEWIDDNTEIEYHTTSQYGYIPLAERQWLEADLAATPYKTIVFVHHALYPIPPEHEQEGVSNAEQVRAILEASGKVVAVLSGHEHKNYSTVINGIKYLLGDNQLGPEYPDNAWAKVVWEKDDTINVYGQDRQDSYLPL